MTTIYLIRHAESEGNLFRTCQGHREELLSQTGLQQCKALHQRFRHISVDAVYSSDLYRAALTAESVVRAQPRDVPHYGCRELREKSLGSLEGKSWGTVFRLRASMRSGNVEGSLDDLGGETNEQLDARSVEIMHRIAARHPDGAVAVVSHGGCISSFITVMFPEEKEACAVCSNTGVYTITFDGGKWTLVDYNSTTHLEAAGVPHASLFRSGITDLWYRPVDFAHDAELVRRMGAEAWQTVYGSLERFHEDVFMENARRMAGFEGCASFCMDGDKIAGLLLLDPTQNEEAGVGHISLVYLYPEYRGQGIGCQLIGRAGVVYRDMGVHTLRLHVARRNKAAIGFYKKHGFRQDARLTLSGMLVMRKPIAIPQYQFAAW